MQQLTRMFVAINLEIQEMIEKGAVEIVEPPPDNYQVVSHLFVRPKKRRRSKTNFQFEKVEREHKISTFLWLP